MFYRTFSSRHEVPKDVGFRVLGLPASSYSFAAAAIATNTTVDGDHVVTTAAN